ncbi:MAG: cytidylate kinase-like family protein [Lachnospiraceae bacterium]|nr:cytidylate kinase-like family protein [Lachnospiraceae bacterium]
MEHQLIISIGREFGSGGHEIAEKLALHYNIPLLDQNLLDEIAKEKEVNVDSLKEMDEKYTNKLFRRTIRGFSSSPQDNVAMMQFEYLQNKAKQGDSFVIVGRCSEDVLKDCKYMVSIFVLGSKEVKRERVMKLYDLNEFMAERLMHEADTKRKRYHNDFCEGKWGDSRNYHISVNSSLLGIEETTKILINFIDCFCNSSDHKQSLAQ